MTALPSPTIPQRLGRLLPVALLAATSIALGGSALGDPAAACAAPREWDIGEYDACLARYPHNPGDSEEEIDEKVQVWSKYCCDSTGGVWDAAKKDCGAPAPEAPQPADPGVIGTPPTVVAPPARGPQPFVPVPGIANTG
jgi:hypothetical protein